VWERLPRWACPSARRLQLPPVMPTKHTTTIALFTAFTAATNLFTSAAQAQSPGAGPAPPANVVNAAPTSPAANATSADPNIDRGFLLPTAMTQPAGSLTYNNYELLLHGITYGITDRVQGTITVLSPIVRDMPFLGFAAIKGRIVATERFHLALQGSLGWGHSFNATDANVYTGGAGAFASYCLRQDCSSLLSASATYQLVVPSGGNDSAHAVVYGGSVVHRVARHVKLLGEVTSAAGGIGVADESENMDGVLVGYGVRFHGDNLAADVGFLKPITGDVSDDEFLVGLPFASVSYRWQ
jgi:hypothetical protein